MKKVLLFITALAVATSAWAYCSTDFMCKMNCMDICDRDGYNYLTCTKICKRQCTFCK